MVTGGPVVLVPESAGSAISMIMDVPEEIRKTIPVGRFGEPSFITGANISANGGQYMHRNKSRRYSSGFSFLKRALAWRSRISVSM